MEAYAGVSGSKLCKCSQRLLVKRVDVMRRTSLQYRSEFWERKRRSILGLEVQAVLCETRCINLIVLEKTVVRRAEGWRKLPNEQIRDLFCGGCYWYEEVEGVVLAGFGGRDRTTYEEVEVVVLAGFGGRGRTTYEEVEGVVLAGFGGRDRTT